MGLTNYKRTQGRPTRQIALCVAVSLLSWVFISAAAVFIRRQSGVLWLSICLVSVVLASMVSVLFLNRPRWADFLISVQSEIDKVTWPSKSEIKKNTIVVLVLLFSMASIVFVFDLVWQWVFKTVGFLQVYSN
jgi:preprotein translocase subunit SecE